MAEPLLLRVVDGLRNAVTGMGTRRDVSTFSAYAAPSPLTREQIDAAYRGSGLMRKIVNIPALDMVREWRDWKLDSEQITTMEAEERRLGIPQKIKQAEVQRRLGGGAIVLGLPGDPATPAPATIAPGQLAYVHVVSRWQISFEALDLDMRSPGYGEPTMWIMPLASGGMARVHPSRVIPLRADTSAYLASHLVNTVDGYWGESTVAQVIDAVQANDTARDAFKALLHKARTMRVGIPGLLEIVGAPGGETKIQTRLEVMREAESIHNLMIYDAGDDEGKGGEEIEDVAYNFAGAKDILASYGEFVAAISDIPASRLLGRSPEGMNASGDSQQKDWTKRIRAEQTMTLTPCMDRLDVYLVPSALGTRPEHGWWEWAPLDTPSEKENAERFKVEMEAIERLQMTGSIPEQAFNRGVQSLMIDRGYLPELEAALLEIPEDERFGVIPDEAEGGGPGLSAGEGGDELEAIPPRRASDAKPTPLYVYRKLLNAADLIAWAREQGFKTTLPADDMHVTVLYSRSAVDPIKMGEAWFGQDDGGLTVKAGGPRAIEKLGEDAIALLFASSHLSWRHREMVEAGASHDYPDYQPHVTITYSAPDGIDLDAIKPFAGELRFGPEIFEPLNEDWKSGISEA